MKILVNQLRPAETQRVLHHFVMPHGVAFDELLKPETWAHVAAAKLHQLDRIEVVAEDGSWYAELMVVHVGRLYAKVIKTQYVNLVHESDAIATPSDTLIVRFGNRHTGHRVHRQSDNTVLKDGFTSAEQAQTWIEDYHKTMAA